MNERREPTIAPLNLDEGQAVKSQTSRAQPVNPQVRAQPSSSKSSRKGPPPVSSRNVKQTRAGSPLAAIALLFAFTACLGAGFIYYQLMQTQQLLVKASQQLLQSDARIVNLEEKLELSGDESVQSMTVLQANIKTNTSEIKKLWGVSYDRNRKSIADNKTALQKLEKTLQSGDSKLNSALAGLKADVSVINELMDAQQGILARVDKVSQGQKGTLSELSNKLLALDKTLSKKVLSNEEAIRAIDAFRVQVNRDLISLKGG